MNEPSNRYGPVVRIAHLSLDFLSGGQTIPALQDVSLHVFPGEIVGLVGESGSGKSVTALNILRLLPADRARVAAGAAVELLGRDVLRLNAREIRALRGRDAAMIFQEPMTALNPVLRVGDQIVDVIRRHRVQSAATARAEAIGLLRDMQITDPERTFEAYPHELSGGMRQRVLIAMAFSCQPKLIIADEPTTALDVTVQAQILTLLKERAAATGTAVLFISHDLAVVASLCDRVYVMYRGAIVEEGPTHQVIHAPKHAYTQALLRALPDGKPAKSRLSTTAAPQTVAHSERVQSTTPLLEIRGVTVRYPNAFDALGRARGYMTAVHDASLTINAGETVSLVGESGSGKTTLANAVLGLAPTSAGTILYNGAPATAAQSNRKIQMVFQDPRGSLNPRWPAWRIISEPLTVADENRTNVLRDAAAHLCGLVGLQTELLNRLPHEFSGGQRQRIAIARALAAEPRLLVLDEPTSALDISVQAQILDLLLDLQQSQHLSYLFISHNVSVVAHISDRVAVMLRGEIVESGDANEIIKHPSHPYTTALMRAVPRLTRENRV